MLEQEYFYTLKYQYPAHNLLYNKCRLLSENQIHLVCHDQTLHVHQAEKQIDNDHSLSLQDLPTIKKFEEMQCRLNNLPFISR